jgi:hypothetical protein
VRGSLIQTPNRFFKENFKDVESMSMNLYSGFLIEDPTDIKGVFLI